MSAKHTFALAFATLLSISQFCYSSVNDTAIKTNWGYRGSIGPEYWGALNKNFGLCSTGKTQSPIDITDKVTKATDKLTIHYQSAPMVIIDNGTTDLMIGKTQTIINDGHGIQLNFSPNTKETLEYNGHHYQLVQFHIHTPSENQLQGKAFPLEIHFVHQGENGEVAVIGVFAQIGENNATLQKIINHLPKTEGKAYRIKNERINPISLLPAQQSHYTFAGSLTTPPCSEGLHWIVMAEPITVSEEQVKKLQEASEGPNARPLQALNDREVKHVVIDAG